MKEVVEINGIAVFEVSSKVFSGHLSLHEIRFALTETLAHLVYLEKRGHLRVSRRDGPQRALPNFRKRKQPANGVPVQPVITFKRFYVLPLLIF